MKPLFSLLVASRNRKEEREFAINPIRFLEKNHSNQGDVFLAKFKLPIYFFAGSRVLNELFKFEFNKLSVYNSPLVKALFGRAIFNLNGSEHLNAKKLLLKSFNSKSLEDIARKTLQIAASHVNKITDNTFDIYELSKAITLDICSQVIIGLQTNSTDYDKFSKMFFMFSRATAIESKYRLINYKYWLGLRASVKLKSIFRKQLDTLDASNPCILGVLHSKCKELNISHEDIMDHLLAILIASRETTASLLTWLIIEIANADTNMPNIHLESSLVLLTPEVLADENSIPLLRSILKETERVHSPNSISLRITNDSLILKGVVIPKNGVIGYSPSSDHFSPTKYTKPDQFCPYRFFKKKFTPELMTFGKGIHVCPGKDLAEQIVLITISQLCSKYKLTLIGTNPTQINYFPVKIPAIPIFARLSDLNTNN